MSKAEDDRQLPQLGERLESKRAKYTVRRLLGKGGFGAVFEVKREADGLLFAIKCERYDVRKKVLSMDCEVLRGAQKHGSAHFVSLSDRGRVDGRFRYLVMKMVGQNLWDLRCACPGRRFSLGTALGMALETLSAIEDLHSIGFLHRDLKPGNFAIGREDIGEQRAVYLLDFGLCRKFADEGKDLRRPREFAPFRGTTRYASLCAHHCKEQSRKDDLETWLYMVVEFVCSALPWSHLKQDKEAVGKQKEQARLPEGLDVLFRECPQREFTKMLQYLDALRYTDVPDYRYMKQIVQHAISDKNVVISAPYDWEQGGTHHAHTSRLPTAAPYSHIRDDE